MKNTVNAGDTRAPQKVTKVISNTEMNAGVTNTRRSRGPPVYAKPVKRVCQTLLATPRHTMPSNSGNSFALDDGAGNSCQGVQRPSRYRAPHYGMPINKSNEGTTCVSMTWRATSGRPNRMTSRRRACQGIPSGPIAGWPRRTWSCRPRGRHRSFWRAAWQKGH